MRQGKYIVDRKGRYNHESDWRRADTLYNSIGACLLIAFFIILALFG